VARPDRAPNAVRARALLAAWTNGATASTNCRSAAAITGSNWRSCPARARGRTLDRASTLPAEDLRRLWAFFQEGGPDTSPRAGWIAARWARCCVVGAGSPPRPRRDGRRAPGRDGAARLLTLYRSVRAAADVAPIVAPPTRSRRAASASARITSRPQGRPRRRGLCRLIDALAPAIVINTTAFSARLDDGATELDPPAAGAGDPRPPPPASWEASTRGSPPPISP
jgi:cobaltochelatase CobN